MKSKPTTLYVSKQDEKIVRLSTIYTASLNLGKTYDAYEAISELHEMLPTNPAIQKSYDFMSKQKESRDVATTISALIDYLKKTGEKDKILTVLASIPDAVKDDPFIQMIRREFLVV